MNFKTMDKYILSKKAATFDYPFDEKTRVYRYNSLTKKQRELLG